MPQISLIISNLRTFLQARLVNYLVQLLPQTTGPDKIIISKLTMPNSKLLLYAKIATIEVIDGHFVIDYTKRAGQPDIDFIESTAAKFDPSI